MKISGPKFKPGDCRECWRYVYRTKRPRERGKVLHFGKRIDLPAIEVKPQIKAKKPPSITECVHRGPELRTQQCLSCNGNIQIKILACELHGECTIAKRVKGTATCETCPDRSSVPFDRTATIQPKPPVLAAVPQLANVQPRWRKRLATTRLPASDHHFQNSVLRYRGRLLMASRVHWAGGQIWLSELDDQYNTTRAVQLDIPPTLQNTYGNEDPRLFVHNGRLFCEFMAVEKKAQGGLRSHVAFAEINEDLSCGPVIYPHYEARREWEKNWAFFEHAGRLFAVYTIAPHRIVEIIDGQAIKFSEVTWHPPTELGDLRGGASPFLFRGELYHFAHGVFYIGKRRWYSVALYTFECEPPFRPSRVIRQPLLLPSEDPEDRWAPHHPQVVFPCGAFLNGWDWVVSFGCQDKWSEVAGWDFNAIESLLEPVPGGKMARLAVRVGWEAYDRAIWQSVHVDNEYGLPDRFQPEDTIVDVGAHIGSFTKLCLDRGAGKVIACEPQPELVKSLLVNVGIDSRLQLVQYAIDGRELLLPDTIGGLSLFGEADQRPVEKVSLDSVLQGGPVRLLKLDCEGAEYAILAQSDLSRVQEVVGEAHSLEWKGRRWTVADIEAILRASSFQAESKLTGEHACGKKTWQFRGRRG